MKTNNYSTSYSKYFHGVKDNSRIILYHNVTIPTPGTK